MSTLFYYECPNCHKADNSEFCSNCGTKMVRLPMCNWCRIELWPNMKFCPDCGRSRHNALNTAPPKKVFWWKKLFGAKKTEPAV